MVIDSPRARNARQKFRTRRIARYPSSRKLSGFLALRDTATTREGEGEDIDMCSSNWFECGALQKNPYILWFNDFSSIAYKANLSNGNSQSSGIDSVGTSSGRTCFPRNNVSIMPSDLSWARLLHFISAADFLLTFERRVWKNTMENMGHSRIFNDENYTGVLSVARCYNYERGKKVNLHRWHPRLRLK